MTRGTSTSDWLKGAIEEAAGRHGCRWVLIDPWNEVEHLWARAGHRGHLSQSCLEVPQAPRATVSDCDLCRLPPDQGGRQNSISAGLFPSTTSTAAPCGTTRRTLGDRLGDDVNTTIRSVKIAKSKNFSYGSAWDRRMRFDQWRCNTHAYDDVQGARIAVPPSGLHRGQEELCGGRGGARNLRSLQLRRCNDNESSD